MRILYKIFGALFCVLLVTSIVSCSSSPKFKYEQDKELSLLTQKLPAYPETRFIVISDLHVYDTALGTEGQAFEEYLNSDRKLIRESAKIMESAVSEIEKDPASFVIIPGDLSKDGERTSHELCASYLSRLEASGKKVFVVPGNHDILNGDAVKYIGDGTERVPNVTPQEFTRIYGDFGFEEALYRDTGSLSYVAEPQNGLWLLALDSCLYSENPENGSPVTDGALNTETLQWIEQTLIRASQQNKAVIAVLHHGIMEHFKGEEKYFGEYVIDGYKYVSQLLSAYNVRMVFTGHYHAEDITMKSWAKNNKYIFDIETGSLVTYPSPYRVITINSLQEAIIRTGNVTSIEGHLTDFQSYSKSYIENGLSIIGARTLEDYGVKPASAEPLAKQISLAFMAHYAGDEKLPEGQAMLDTRGLGLRAWIVTTFRRGLISGLWHDLKPSDNNITINLVTGNWQ